MISISPFSDIVTFQQFLPYTVVLLVVSCITWAYRHLVPRPLPGIPYAASSNGFLGDIPALMRYQSETGRFFDFMRHRCLQLQSPIVQIFPKPWQAPWVVVCDSQETIDILGRRSSEFDRPDFIIEALQAVVPNSQLVLKTGDEWRRHRRLTAETMSPWFLDTISRIHIQPRYEELIRMWSEKARLANGRPFDISEDVFETILDIVWAAAFGSPSGVTAFKAHQLAKLDQLNSLPNGADHPAVFPSAPLEGSFKAFLNVMDSLKIFFLVPAMPGLIHKAVATMLPSLRRSFSRIDAEIKARVAEAQAKMHHDGHENNISCAADVLVNQEIGLSLKQNTNFDPAMADIRGELLTFVLGSLETTAATLCWALKFLTSDQATQLRLKTNLEATYASKVSSMLTAEEILACKAPYLDAVVEEVLRCSGTIQALSRQAVVDTQILGHFIPKGTQVYFPTTGPGYQQPAFDIRAKRRSFADQEKRPALHNWDSMDMAHFKPERWLKSGKDGQQLFNQQAGFQPAFGSGIRRCFGMKLARILIKMALANIILNFELNPTPAALSSFEGVDKSIYSAKQAYIRL